MQIIDFYPSRGSFIPGETVTLLVEIESPAPRDVTLRTVIRNLAEQEITVEQQVRLVGGVHTVPIHWLPPATSAGYSARLEILPGSGFPDPQAATAFDVLPSWTSFPRYGFLTDFGADRPDPEAVLRKLSRFHINGLQFYDWQYRHDQLLAPGEEYIDPLGRDISLVMIRRMVDLAHQAGMAAMPYLAVYAASVEFWRAHPVWALYDEAGEPIPFGENFLGLMDPSAGSLWSQHLLAEAARVLDHIPFDGLHIDQYGKPRLAWDVRHQPVDLPRAFVDFVQAASEQHAGQTILFNAVENWPIEELAGSAVDFLYIEVWPPDVEYRHLAEIVLNAVRLSRGKPVVVALYLPSSRPANNLLTDAVILACGGTRIELGEDTRLLSDPYFPNHEEISPELLSGLRKLYDFAVRNGEWLRPYTLSTLEREVWSQAELNPETLSIEGDLWIVARSHREKTVLQLVNFTGLPSHLRWDEPHARPDLRQQTCLRMQRPERPTRIFWDSPERTDGPMALDFEYVDGILSFQIPQLEFTGLVVIHE